MPRVAAIDCGTNSVRLLVADVEGDRVTDVVRQTRVVRLGQDVDRTGVFAAAALERTRTALRDYAATIAASGATRVRMVATSAARDVANRGEFEAMVRAELGTGPKVVSGLEEARLSFAGAAGALPGSGAPLLVADLGGGSTELVLGLPDGTVQAHSMDVGCVRMTERHLPDDPPTAAQVGAVVAEVRSAAAAARADVAWEPGMAFVGVAGTVTTIAALALRLRRHEPGVIHGSVLSYDQVQEVTAALLAMTRPERGALPVMHPGRVDVICAGAVILRTLMEQLGAGSVVASEHDILDGIALGLAR